MMNSHWESAVRILAQCFDDQLEALRLSLIADFAIVSSICGNVYTLLAVTSELKLPSLAVGHDFPCRDSYCKQVVRSQQMLIHTHLEKFTHRMLHPVFTVMQPESYIGEPLWIRGDVVGTLNFSGFTARPRGYCDQAIAQVKGLARAIEVELR